MTEFKVGDRVAYYSGKFGRKTGTVNQFIGLYLFVLGDDEGHYAAHPKQCRKLKPRDKSVRVTRMQLATAWDTHVAGYQIASFDSDRFTHFAEGLGFKDET